MRGVLWEGREGGEGEVQDDLTIAVLSAVEPPLPECLKSVEAQHGGPYQIVRVHDIFPMSRAFKIMIERCQSRFIVQVDADAVLEPWAVRTLHERIRREPWAYMAWGQLWEDYGDRLAAGGSVRIWRRWPLRLFRFRDRRCVDRDLHARIRWTGMRRVQVRAGWRFGTHLPRQTAFARFSKARGDAMKWRVLGRSDLIKAHHKQYPPGLSIDALGRLSGLQAPTDEVWRSKDARKDWHEFLRIGGRYAGGQGQAATQAGVRGFQPAGAEILPGNRRGDSQHGSAG